MKSGEKYNLVIPLRLYDFGEGQRETNREGSRDSREER
jgi:hypothetical protein